MATDAGVKQALVDKITALIETRKNKVGTLNDRLRFSQLEDAAQATLTPSDIAVLATVVDPHNTAAIQAELDQTQQEITALQNLRQAVRAVN